MKNIKSIENLENLVVIVDHPFGKLEMPLKVWMETGPQSRILLRPIGVMDKNGQILDLNIIPLKYRNSPFSRLLIKLGFIETPW